MFLTAVVAVAVRYGPRYRPCWRVVAASLALQFLLSPPRLHFHDREIPRTSPPFFLFALVAVIVSNLASRTRLRNVIAKIRAIATETLYGFSRKLAGCGTLDDVLWATAFQVAAMLKVRVVMLLPERPSPSRAGYPPEDRLDDADLAAAQWAFDNDRPAGRGADTLPGAKRLFLPMRTGRGRSA